MHNNAQQSQQSHQCTQQYTTMHNNARATIRNNAQQCTHNSTHQCTTMHKQQHTTTRNNA
eukprot:9657061-Lingulodinium_polyedra.AAC.1